MPLSASSLSFACAWKPLTPLQPVSSSFQLFAFFLVKRKPFLLNSWSTEGQPFWGFWTHPKCYSSPLANCERASRHSFVRVPESGNAADPNLLPPLFISAVGSGCSDKVLLGGDQPCARGCRVSPDHMSALGLLRRVFPLTPFPGLQSSHSGSSGPGTALRPKFLKCASLLTFLGPVHKYDLPLYVEVWKFGVINISVWSRT